MGASGQGCFFGACLAKAESDVTFIARGVNLEALKARGVTLKSKTLGEFTVHVKATDRPSEINVFIKIPH
jgi:2-dehydropantoate 2-reductase